MCLPSHVFSAQYRHAAHHPRTGRNGPRTPSQVLSGERFHHAKIYLERSIQFFLGLATMSHAQSIAEREAAKEAIWANLWVLLRVS